MIRSIAATFAGLGLLCIIAAAAQVCAQEASAQQSTGSPKDDD
jgi:hypothetical protein